MKKPLATLAAITALFAVGSAHAKAPICGSLSNFVRDQMMEKAEPAPRHWVEMHWNFDRAAIFSKGCKHSGDLSSGSLCMWMMQNTGFEFGPSVLPLQVLDCFGFKSPRRGHYDWHVSDGEFRHSYADGTWLLMELVSKNLPEGEFALRLSVEIVERKLDPDELEPVAHLEPDLATPAQ